MAEEEQPESDSEAGGKRAGMLSRLSNEMARAQKKHFGTGPTKAKSYMLDSQALDPLAHRGQ